MAQGSHSCTNLTTMKSRYFTTIIAVVPLFNLNLNIKINRRKILAVTTQLKQLRKESLKKIQA